MSDKFVLGPIQTQWLESLENNPDRQLQGALGKKLPDGSYKACCLGEGGLIAGVCEWDEDRYLKVRTFKFDGAMTLGSGFVLTSVYVSLGLRNSTGRRLDDDDDKCLAAMNDAGVSWARIAKYIREEPEQYFEKSV